MRRDERQDLLNQFLTTDASPPKVKVKIASFMSITDLARTQLVSKNWFTLFSHPCIYKDKLTEHLGITPRMVTCALPDSTSEDCKKIYRGLTYLRHYQRKHIFPINLPLGQLKKTHLKLLLICCSDNAELFLKKLSKANSTKREQWLLISLYARAEAIPIALIKKYAPQPTPQILNYAAEAGNLTVVEYLLNPKNKCCLLPMQQTLDNAARSGNFKLLCLLLHFKSTTKTQRPKTRLRSKYSSHSILPAPDDYNYAPSIVTLWSAAYSGNLKLLQFLLNPRNDFGLSATKRVLDNAAASGNFLCVRHCLVDYKMAIQLRPDIKTLNAAICAGDFKTVLFLLDPYNAYNIKPNKESLRQALHSKNKAIEKTIRAQIPLKNAILHLAQGKLDTKTLENLQKNCPDHFRCVLSHIISYPNQYYLTRKNINKLLQLKLVTQSILADQKNVLYAPSEVEKENINRFEAS